MEPTAFADAHSLVNLVTKKEISVRTIIDSALERINRVNPTLNAYTTVTHQRAQQTADQADARLKAGEKPRPLEGVPFAVKNLYDIKDIVTLAGSKINADNTPAAADAVLIKRLENAGAILLGSLAMGEYAYDFTGENSHYGNCANPWAPERMSGGSSSGSGSACAGGIAPIALGSDTNGSIRVPASFCGIFGLKPTYGRLPRTGSYPFCDSLDHLGPLARTAKDLSLSFDIMQGYDANDHGCAKQPILNTFSTLNDGLNTIKMKKAVGYFDNPEFPQAQQAVSKICHALNVNTDSTAHTVELVGTLEGRSAAYLITNVEGSALHKTRLQTRSHDFDPDTRDRFLAGTMLPAQWYIRAQQVRHWYRNLTLKAFEDTDIIIAPATPFTAPLMGEKHFSIHGVDQLLRPNLGYFTQPISSTGFPSVVVPTIDDNTGMPIGVQIIAAPWREDLCLRVAYYLEQQGFTAKQPTGITHT